MPKGLEIDYSKPLNGTMAPYAEQVLICTGQPDWSSRIESEENGNNLAAQIKKLMGRGGKYCDPYNNVSITNVSFPPYASRQDPNKTTSVYVLPSFKYIPFVSKETQSSVEALVEGYLLPTKLNSAHDNLSPTNKERLLRRTPLELEGVEVQDLLVLICGHGTRDMRCGILGPILESEFMEVLGSKKILVGKGAVTREDIDRASQQSVGATARVGLISHIGGHKFAGNVILYIPSKMKMKTGDSHPLAGCGIWYGRVEPRHVEGIVEETILQGNVIKDIFRGGIRQGGEILRI